MNTSSRFGARLALLCAIPLVAQTADLELPLMGLRVRNTTLTLNPAGSPRDRQPLPLVLVTGVLEHGPAYDAGIVPGDVIYKIGRWSSLTADGIRQTIAQYYRENADMAVWVYYRYGGAGAPKCLSFGPSICSMEATVHLRTVAPSRWIDTVPIHDGPNESPWGGRRKLAGLQDSQANGKKAYQDLRERDLQFLTRNGCQTTDAELQRMITELKNTSASAGMSDQGDEYILANTRASACTNSRTGALPQFEGALYAMTDARRLDPCSFDRKADYSSVLNNPDYAQFQNKPSYDSAALRRFENYLRRTDAARKACFLDLIQAEISGAR